MIHTPALLLRQLNFSVNPFALQHLLFPGHWGCLTLSKRVGLGTVVEAKAKYWASCPLSTLAAPLFPLYSSLHSRAPLPDL